MQQTQMAQDRAKKSWVFTIRGHYGHLKRSFPQEISSRKHSVHWVQGWAPVDRAMMSDGFAMWLSGLQRCCRACWSCPWASICLRVALGTSGQRSDWKPRFVRRMVTGHTKQFQKRFIGITKNVTILLSLVLLCFFWSSDCWGIEGDIGRVHLWIRDEACKVVLRIPMSRIIPILESFFGPNSFQHSTLFGWLGCAGRCKSWWYNRSELSLARPNLQVNCGKLSFFIFFLQPTEASRYIVHIVHLRAPQRILRSSQSSSLGGARPENNQNCIIPYSPTDTSVETSVRKTSSAAVPDQRDQRTGSALSLQKALLSWCERVRVFFLDMRSIETRNIPKLSGIHQDPHIKLPSSLSICKSCWQMHRSASNWKDFVRVQNPEIVTNFYRSMRREFRLYFRFFYVGSSQKWRSHHLFPSCFVERFFLMWDTLLQIIHCWWLILLEIRRTLQSGERSPQVLNLWMQVSLSLVWKVWSQQCSLCERRNMGRLKFDPNPEVKQQLGRS